MSAFVGRRNEIAEITALFERARLVTLSGAGGVGKSRLGREVARRIAPGAAVVDVAEMDGTDALTAAVLDALACSTASLLVLDTCEALVERVAALVSGLLAADPGLRVLAIGRQSLTLPGEHLRVLTGLPADEACSLLANLSGAWLPEVCDRLDGLPLAIELAAVRLRTMPVAEFLAGLDDRLGLLVDESRDGASRHRALATCVGWSHQLCTAQERLLWARASIFAGEFDLEAVTYVCQDAMLDVDDMVDVVAGLVDKSVLTRRQTPAGVRFRISEAARAFGAGWLALLGQDRDVRLRHHDFYLRLAQRAEFEWPRRQVWWSRGLRLEAGNLLLALETGLETGSGLDLAATLWPLWVCCGMREEGGRWLDRALAPRGEPGPVRTRALWVRAWVAALGGDLATAEERLAECREGDPGDQAAAYRAQVRAQIAAERGQVSPAVALLRDARDRHRRAGAAFPGLPVGHAAVAECLLDLGALDAACEVLADGLELCEEGEQPWIRSRLLHLRAQAGCLRGEPAGAVRHAREALRIARLLGDRAAQVAGVEILGALAVAEGRREEGATLLAAARGAWGTLGDGHPRSPVLSSIAGSAAADAERAGFGGSAGCGGRFDLETAVDLALGEPGERRGPPGVPGFPLRDLGGAIRAEW
ncbi:hypothetical protein GCM10017673_37330 [Streptosporangium violaceochromogenes]|nr:hypothetical protein GCM10017673_37330 [Streptosporangium violaceochromogenes]